MSRHVPQGRKTTENRAKGRRFAPACAGAGSFGLAAALALPLALGLTAGLAPEALAQANSGIFINNDVLNNLGPGPAATPGAPLAPQPGYAPDYAPAPMAPGQQQSPGNLGFQPRGSGNFVVTRPGTLLFPPLEAPTSTLAPGFGDNHAARTKAMNEAFAEGPEPSSQLLIPLDNNGGANGGSDSSIVVYMDNLPAADGAAAAEDAPVLTLRRPPLATPKPAPRKPEVSPEMLAEVGVTTVDEPATALAPEFQAPESFDETPAAPAPGPAMAEVPAVAEVETSDIGETPAATAPSPEMPSEMPAPKPESAPQVAATSDAAPTMKAETTMAEATPPAGETAPSTDPVSLLPAESSASATRTPVASSDVPAPVTNSVAKSGATAPGLQTASLSVGAVEDMTVTFDHDSAELSDLVQAELRSLANSLRDNDDSRVQVLGFASADGSSQDLARKLALSRALKVRTFLIDAGVPSGRIQVRSLGDKSEGGPANRVDIRPIDS